MEQLSLKLDAFEGPLDLLLHLIQKNKVNIYDIPIVLITDQYMEYIEQAGKTDLEISSEFLVMAARLLYIKSKMLLPKHEELEEEEEEDPRQELIQNLIEYKKYKEVSEFFGDRKNICDYMYFKAPGKVNDFKVINNAQMPFEKLADAFQRVMEKFEERNNPSKESFEGIVGREPVPVKGKIKQVKRVLNSKGQVSFVSLFKEVKSKSEIVAIFLAVLELIRDCMATVCVNNNEVYINNCE
ncbi:MAG: segregation/condensation protein A [Clostridia bacterium]|nr:segregation/condensation protein A [Clostridia bacterium]